MSVKDQSPGGSAAGRWHSGWKASSARGNPPGQAPAGGHGKSDPAAAGRKPALRPPTSAWRPWRRWPAGGRLHPLRRLVKTRTQTVFGVGNPYARLVFVGEAPGADEDRQGEPFVGRAGQLLNDIIVKGMKMRREDVYILNILRCRPPGNRTPLPVEAATCREYLDAQLAVIQPEFLCCLGAVPRRTSCRPTLPSAACGGGSTITTASRSSARITRRTCSAIRRRNGRSGMTSKILMAAMGIAAT